MTPPKIILVLVLILLVSGCREAAPTPVALEIEEETAVPTETATVRPTNTPAPTDTPAPTFTFTPSITPLPYLIVFVMDEAGEAMPPGSSVLLDDAGLTFHAEQTVAVDGQATFVNLVVGETYTVTVKADGYLDTVLPIKFNTGENELQIALEPGVFVTVVGDGADLHDGPGLVYGRTGTVESGEVLQVIGQDEGGEWLLVLTTTGEEAWLAASVIDLEGINLTEVTAVPTVLWSPRQPSICSFRHKRRSDCGGNKWPVLLFSIRNECDSQSNIPDRRVG